MTYKFRTNPYVKKCVKRASFIFLGLSLGVFALLISLTFDPSTTSIFLYTPSFFVYL